jgi:hypothetical protein
VTREGVSPGRVPPTRARVKQLPKESVHRPPTRVYVAAPVTVFGTGAHRLALEVIGERFPDAQLLDAAVLFADSGDWHRRWPAIVRTLDHLIFITQSDGLIGAGVFQEVLDARFRGASVEYLMASGTFVAVEDVTFRMVGAGDARRFARVRVSRSR